MSMTQFWCLYYVRLPTRKKWRLLKMWVFEVKFKNLMIFLFHRNMMFHSWEIQYFVFQTISSTSELVTSWRVLNKAKFFFEYICWILSHLCGHKTWSTKRQSHISNSFRKYFAWFGGQGRKSRSFLIYQPTTAKSHLWWVWFCTLLKLCTETIKKNIFY